MPVEYAEQLDEISTAVAATRKTAPGQWRALAEHSVHATTYRIAPMTAIVGSGLGLGTGGLTTAEFATANNTGPSLLRMRHGSEFRRRLRAVTASEQVIEIRSALGLNITELSDAIGVQRPTIYSWQAGNAEPHGENHRRLRALYDLALYWQDLSSEPMGDWVRIPLQGEASVTTLLAAGADRSAIEQAFSAIKARVEEDSATYANVRNAAERFGHPRRTFKKQQASVDRETIF